jgi:hypothetical protein
VAIHHLAIAACQHRDLGADSRIEEHMRSTTASFLDCGCIRPIDGWTKSGFQAVQQWSQPLHSKSRFQPSTDRSIYVLADAQGPNLAFKGLEDGFEYCENFE